MTYRKLVLSNYVSASSRQASEATQSNLVVHLSHVDSLLLGRGIHYTTQPNSVNLEMDGGEVYPLDLGVNPVVKIRKNRFPLISRRTLCVKLAVYCPALY